MAATPRRPDEDTAGAPCVGGATAPIPRAGRGAPRRAAEPAVSAAALLRLLEELPDVDDGLSRTERQLLELLDDGPLLTGGLFVASQDLEEAPFHGDAWILMTLAELTPLVSLTEGSAELTDDGRRVLAGDLDRVELLGIDRWVGGTHLQPGAVWRWDADASELVPPS